MTIFKCKMCGGDLEINEKMTVGTCEYCGSTMTLPKDTDDKKANLFNRANHFRRNNDFDKALTAYENILNEDNSDAEAHWGVVLCKYGIEYVEDPKTHERVPTCHRTQYESIYIDPDYKQAIANADSSARLLYEAEAKKIDAIQKGILEISSKEEPFDVFICYKETDEAGSRTKDSVIAQDIYYHLTEEGFKVFFSRITLEDKLGSAYEPYIFAALHSSKVMVVVGTKPEHFNSTWTKNEWSRFLALIKKGEKKVLIPSYKDMDPYDLPEEFSHLQAQDMGKIGFIQDLVRGIKKVVNSGESKASTMPAANGNAAIQPLLDRAYLCLEDGDFTKADDLVEQVLNLDPRSAQAYVAKLMIELKVNQEAQLTSNLSPLTESNNYQKAIRFADNTLKQTLESYNQVILDRLEEERKERFYQEINAQKRRSSSEKEYQTTAQMYRQIAGYKDAKEQAADCDQLAEQARIKAEEARLREEQRRLEAERKRQILEAKRKKQIRLAKIVVPIVVVLVTALILLMNYVIVLAPKYNKAQNLLANGQYDEAISVFKELGNYKDSAEIVNESNYTKAQNLRANGKLIEAISVFKELGKYKDSAEMVIASKALLLANTKAGDLIKFGKYEQDNDKTNGKEDIAWKVLDIQDGKALLLSEKNLDKQQYNIEDGYNISSWLTCTLRDWLNTTFYAEAFTAGDQGWITETEVVNNDNPKYGTLGWETTNDKVFLLSIEEANQYFKDDAARISANTAYVVAQGADDEGGNGWWWLRSPGQNDGYAASVSSDGFVSERGEIKYNRYVAVRPACWINLES